MSVLLRGLYLAALVFLVGRGLAGLNDDGMPVGVAELLAMGLILGGLWWGVWADQRRERERRRREGRF